MGGDAAAAPIGEPFLRGQRRPEGATALEDARERIAAGLGAEPDEVIFTSGATEANNLAVLGLARGAVIASQLEHPCVIEPLHQREGAGSRSNGCRWIRGAWLIVGHSLRRRRPRSESPTLVCLMLANHETGAIQPVRDIARLLPSSVALHCDAAQAVGKIPVNFRELGATTLSASAHKFGGPKGIGVLAGEARDEAATADIRRASGTGPPTGHGARGFGGRYGRGTGVVHQ